MMFADKRLPAALSRAMLPLTRFKSDPRAGRTTLKQTHDVIVLGLGGVGSATAHHLASMGHRVLGLDRFSPPHRFGSSHGETRIIRKAYFEHVGYVPLLCRAYELWKQLELDHGARLLHLTGLIQIGPPQGMIIPGILESASRFHLPIDRLTMREAENRFPLIRGESSWSAVLEKDAGYLCVEACVDAHLQSAKRMGAQLQFDEPVLDWKATSSGVIVATAKATYSADRLVITAGPWADQWLSRYGVQLRVLRKHLYWYRIGAEGFHETAGFPCFFFETPDGCFYGFPERDSLGLKVARHSGGRRVMVSEDGAHPRDAEDQRLVERFMRDHLPAVSLELTRTEGCYYTMSPDEHFIVDRLPDAPQVTYVAGLSGHGFKFASVLGEMVALLATDHEPPFDIEFLKSSRF
jgi:monomeric sarcosine oxidase